MASIDVDLTILLGDEHWILVLHLMDENVPIKIRVQAHT